MLRHKLAAHVYSTPAVSHNIKIPVWIDRFQGGTPVEANNQVEIEIVNNNVRVC